jgi:tocopherol O-methyltransferase
LIVSCPEVTKAAIRSHHDLATPFYRLLWGPHIHHGLWDPMDDCSLVSPVTAQARLTDTLADLAAVGPDQRVLDVGCGMGDSSIRLVKRHRCLVTGITLSPVQ